MPTAIYKIIIYEKQSYSNYNLRHMIISIYLVYFRLTSYMSIVDTKIFSNDTSLTTQTVKYKSNFTALLAMSEVNKTTAK